jgi:heme/copper-type cytochrome/quinol oxidase subunit 3
MSTVPVPVEPPEVEMRVQRAGSYLLAGAIAFFFVAFLFAFLYLRALNNNGLWGGGKPGHHVHPALTAGIVILVCVLASVALAQLGKRAAQWRLPAGGGALALGLVAVGVQCWQYSALGFGPGDGGYASVYLGWTGFFTIFAFGALLWLEAVLASAIRSDVVGMKLEADVASFALVWTMLGFVEIAAFVLLFVVQ